MSNKLSFFLKQLTIAQNVDKPCKNVQTFYFKFHLFKLIYLNYFLINSFVSVYNLGNSIVLHYNIKTRIKKDLFFIP